MKCQPTILLPRHLGGTRAGTMLLLMAVMVALAAPGAQAAVDLLPPSGLDAAHLGNGTVQLEWNPPGEGVYTYNLYRNMKHVAQTADTWHKVDLSGSLDVFHVTASRDGVESAPSEPLVVHENDGVRTMVGTSGGEVGVGGACEPVGTMVDRDNFPYFFVVLQPECVPLPIEAPVVLWWG